MPWLVRDADVLASVEEAWTRRERRRGLIGRDDLEGVLILTARSVHTFGVRFPIDVAFCAPVGDGAYRVVRVVTVAPRRITQPSRRGTVAVEAPAGSFRRWGVRPGDRLEVR